MKLNKNFIKTKVDGKTVVVPVAGTEFNGIVQGNRTFGDIIDCLSEDTTEEKIVDYMCGKYSGERSVIESDVKDVVSRLKKIGAIDE